MVEINLSQARDELRNRGFDGLSDSRCNVFLNAAKNNLEDALPWPWLQASTSGTAPVTIADLKMVRHVWIVATNMSLNGADDRWLRETCGPDLTVPGVATWWYLDGLTTLNVFPADTTSTVNVSYIKFSDELSADGDQPLFPQRLHPLWVDLACVEAYNDSDEFAAAQTLQAKCDMKIAQQAAAFFGRNLQNPGLSVSTGDWY